MTAPAALPPGTRWFSLSAVIALAMAAIARDFPMAGHDYGYFIPRLLDTSLHVRQHGLSIQWYTPTFGGGLPAFPNPQHLEYSLLMPATLMAGPWAGPLLITALVMLAGFLACEAWLRRTVGVGEAAAILGATMFVGNGFYFEHMIVGHLGFQMFPIAALLAWLVTDDRRSLIGNTAMLGLTMAAIVYHSGFHLIILQAMSVLLAIAVIEAAGLRRFNGVRILITVAGGALIAGLIALPKVYAVLSLMRQFPREVADVFDAGLIQALAGFVAQLTLTMAAAPIMWLLHLDLAKLSAALMKVTGASPRIGIWEIDTSVSPVLWLLLGVSVMAAARDLRSAWTRQDRRRLAALAAALVITWVVVEMTLARGLVYPLIQSLPIMRSLHVNVRYAAILILPLTVLGTIALDRLVREGLSRRLVLAAVALAAVSPVSYVLLPAEAHFRTFDLRGSIEADARIRRGDTLPVTAVADVTDAEALASGRSSLRPNEALFGYALETFHTQVVPGDVHEQRDGRFNLTNPAGLVFPELTGVHPFDRIRVEDAANLAALTRRGIPDWTVPPIHARMVMTALTVAVIALLAAAASFLVTRRANHD